MPANSEPGEWDVVAVLPIRRYSFRTHDDVWIVHTTTETDIVTVFDKLNRDGFEATALILLN